MAEQTTVMVIEITHKKQLPSDLKSAIEKRLYDYCSAKTGDQVEVSFADGVSLEVRNG